MSTIWFTLNNSLIGKNHRNDELISRSCPQISNFGDVIYVNDDTEACDCQWVITRDARVCWLNCHKIQKIADSNVKDLWSTGYSDSLLVLLENGDYMLVKGETHDCENPTVEVIHAIIPPNTQVLGMLENQRYVAISGGVFGIYQFAFTRALVCPLGYYERVKISDFILYGVIGNKLYKHKIDENDNVNISVRNIPAYIVGKPIFLGKVLIDQKDVYHYHKTIGYVYSYTLPSPVVEYHGERALLCENGYKQCVLCENRCLYLINKEYYFLALHNLKLPHE